MRIAFVHYHLKTGGVTTVIKRQVDAIQNTCDVLTITGYALFVAVLFVVANLIVDILYGVLDPRVRLT